MVMMCTVRLLDQVNVRLTGIDEVTLKKAADQVTYTVKNSRFMEAVRMKRWNGKKSLVDRRNGSTFRHVLNKVLEPIAAAGYEIEIIDSRYPDNIRVQQIENNLFEGFEYKRFKGIMEPHQVNAINALTSNGGGIIKLPTASGKTVVTAGLAQLYYPWGKILIVVPRTDLALETRDTIQALGMPDCGAYFDEVKEPRHVTVTTWQSLAVMPELFQDVNMILVDECLAGATKVKTPTGEKPIREMKAGDAVVSYDETNKVFVEDVVEKVHINSASKSTEKMYELEFDNGSVLHVTGNHKILTTNGWKRADKLEVHDDILSM
jgi:Straboviridae ATP-dependent DNA helicase UvsW